jgi:hypothetical protein
MAYSSYLAMGYKTPRGHSNVYADETKPEQTEPGDPFAPKAIVPIVGGANLETCRGLPSLYLSKAEWEIIGRKMGWIKPKQRQVRR